MDTLKEMNKLKKVGEKYQANMKNLIASKGALKYVRIERALNAEDIRLRRKLGILVPDPCPIGHSKSCNDCTGEYSYRMVKEGKKIKYKAKEVFEREEDDIVKNCRLKDISLKGSK